MTASRSRRCSAPLRGTATTRTTGVSTQDPPGTWEANYRTVVVGSTMDSVEPGGPVNRVYDNCFILNFDADGCCREFTEW